MPSPAVHPAPPQAATMPPTFLVGSVRSGTTLLRLMLDHHPQIAFHFEFEFAVDRLGPNGEAPPIADYHAYLNQDRVFQLSGAEIDRGLPYPELVHSFLEQKRQEEGKPLVGATVHCNFDKLPTLWPDAKYVHLIRDGRDVARSCIAMGWYGNMFAAVDRWIEAERCWLRLADKIPQHQRMEVRYEDLVTNPEPTLTRVCEFIGVPFDSGIFRYAEESTYGMPDPSLLSQWRRKLTNNEVQLAESRINGMLTERGYDLSGLPLLTLTEHQQRRLRRHDWLQRARFRLKRYGPLLFATDYVARRCGLRPLARACKRRTDAIDNQHLK